ALTKADLIGFATCHRLPARSLFVDGHQLPLCARCTGIYIGMLTGWTYLIARRRLRAAQFPTRPMLTVLIAFIAVMGVDGINSTLMLIPGAPHLYETENWMRLLTGSLYGLAISMLLTPYVTVTLWREPSGERTLKGWGELLLLVNLAAVLAMLALTEADFLFWPLVAVSVVGVLGLMGLMNTSIVTIAAGRVNVYAGWRQLAVPLLFGVALSLVEFVAIGAFRASLGL
ncbi:MAG TPA: DUF2085 domain-containing protein, partial [Anaerolineae bacterium]|nr:DUF2085 domain-containing protein [Anaerolineae bacterium]